MLCTLMVAVQTGAATVGINTNVTREIETRERPYAPIE